tara:strand:+ start:905 stop:1936 length:1032 start_codon:yes stop_codon:yes gene_type:complete
MFFYPAIRSLLFYFDAEVAHRITINFLKTYQIKNNICHPSLSCSIFGLNFTNPVGLAAGFDKNSEVPNNIINLGFGFSEVGTVTPLPQSGNSKPRVFRLKNENAIINRLGFNNEGFEVVKERLFKRENNIIGVNIGANKNSKDFINDYIKGIKFFSSTASYLTINISSPNTPGLRDLQSIDSFSSLLNKIDQLKKNSSEISLPILIKISPDINDNDLESLCEKVLSSSIDGLIISNTTISRHSVSSEEKGGLSGDPLFDISTRKLNEVYKHTEGKIPLIGVGGVDTAEKAYKKIKNGASLIQLYTGLVYKGPKLINEINKGLIELIEKDGFKNISEAVGVEVN